MDNYIIGIYDDRPHINNKELANRYKDLTEFFIRHMKSSMDNFVIGTSINKTLNKALETGKDYCILMSVGHFLNSPKFFTYIENWINSVDFFVTGHIMDLESDNSQRNSKGHYWGLHRQCAVINLKYYEEFGRPEWGDKFKSEETITVAKAKRATTDIHDDYTPIFLDPTNETQICTPYVDGWNFINKSLENGLKVYNFHPRIRVTKRYAYPNKSLEELKNQLTWIVNILEGAPNCVFLWNTESYREIKKYSGNPIKKLYSVAAAFKPNFMLETIGFDEDTEVVYFDYSKQALAFKKLLLEKWDGKDYPQFLRKIKKEYRINETFGAQTEGKSYEELWERELNNWKSEEILYNHWQKYKNLKHTFIHCDVLEEPEKIINAITEEENSYIWWSNVFHTVNAHYTRSLDVLTEEYNNFVSNIKKQNQDIRVFGMSHLNKRLLGENISDCFNNREKENNNGRV